MPQDLRPYLLSATYEFIIDRNETPYITVWADERCAVPREFVKEQIINRDGEVAPIITLNISMSATPNLEIPKEGSAIIFNGSFRGRKMEVFVPFDCILAMYSFETPNHAMAFEYVTSAERQNEEAAGPHEGKPNLKVIK